MAYSELIKNFDKIRDYMRDFYVFGFRTRSDFDEKSKRSYDNERRRVESWLGDAMNFHQDASGKSLFISVDTRSIAHNPLYQAFLAKSFTDTDITLHFYIMDILADGEEHSLREISEGIEQALSEVQLGDDFPDDATIRNKLREYVSMGLLSSVKSGREVLYRRADTVWAPEKLLPAIAFASEVMPLGVVGSYLLGKAEKVPDDLSFKHHYLAGAFDAEVLYDLLSCRRQQKKAEIHFFTRRSKETHPALVYPLKVYISTQSGRENLVAYNYELKRPRVYRLNRIRRVKMMEPEQEPEKLDQYGRKFAEKLWGVSAGPDGKREADHLEMVIRVEEGEKFILGRLLREKRIGTAEELEEGLLKFEADVCDAMEMLPWIRTFTGRIVSLSCSNPELTEWFYGDLDEMMQMYGVQP